MLDQLPVVLKFLEFKFYIHLYATQLKKIIYPKGVFVIKYDQSSVDDKFIASIISFIYFYFVIFFILAALLSLTGLDFITSISGAATSISNVGPGLGPIIGPNGDFSSLPDISKWILTIGMILGRLELFAILVLFSAIFLEKLKMIEIKKQSLSETFSVYFDRRMLRILLLGAISGFPWVLIGSSLSLWLKRRRFK